MIKTLKIKSVEIGANPPKIIVPIVGKTFEEVTAKAKELQTVRIDMVEWRADHFQEIFDKDRTLCLLRELRNILERYPLLFTFRTKKEGGEKDIAMNDYVEMNATVAKSGHVDLIDVEAFSDGDAVQKNISIVHDAGVYVIGSYHNFQATPPKEELVGMLRKMQEMGVDIPKIAVKPNSVGDVLTLLAATNDMYEKYADRPIFTMSMTEKGVVSRLAGGIFGSAMTFGAVGQVSAPGQIPASQLAQVLDILYQTRQQ